MTAEPALKRSDYSIYEHYFGVTWTPYRSLSEQPTFALKTNMSWEVMLRRPVGKDGRDANGNIAPFHNNGAMWSFIKSHARRLK